MLRTPWDVPLDLLQVQWPRSKAKPILQHQIPGGTDLVRIYLMGCRLNSANNGSLEILDSVYGKAQPRRNQARGGELVGTFSSSGLTTCMTWGAFQLLIIC